MYDLSVPRSAVARFSTPSSSRKAVPRELMATLFVKMALSVSSCKNLFIPTYPVLDTPVRRSYRQPIPPIRNPDSHLYLHLHSITLC